MPFASSSAMRSFGIRAAPLAAAAAAALSITVYTAHSRFVGPLRNDDTPFELAASPISKSRISMTGVANPLTPLGWGSNRYMTLLPSFPTQQVKRPTPLPQLGATPLRDLVVQEKYGACVDARGDLWMWGAGYDPSGAVGKSLRGKSLRTLAPGPAKLFALSKGGHLYVVSADKAFQDHRPNGGRAWWKRLTTRDPGVDYVELKADQSFHWGERWAGIAVGRHHLLAVTNKGRTFSLPLSPSANTHRQLGTRQAFDTPETIQAAIAASPNLPPEADPRFATKLTEIPALSGIAIAQVAAGDRTSFVRTPAGRVLGFGANEAGQIGLGASTVIDLIPTPVEIVLAKAYPSGSSVRCTNVIAGYQTTFFTVERTLPGISTPSIDLLSCGNGISGALGSGIWSSASYGLSKVKTLSGLQEFSEKDQSVLPLSIYSVSVSSSPSAHVFAVLDTVRQADIKGLKKGFYGKDVMVWGGNADYQLGNGKRSSLAIPQHLPPLVPHASDTILAAPHAESNVSAGTVTPMPHSRLQLHQTKADAYDLEGKLIRRGVKAEETIVAGYNVSVLYNKIID